MATLAYLFHWRKPTCQFKSLGHKHAHTLWFSHQHRCSSFYFCKSYII